MRARYLLPSLLGGSLSALFVWACGSASDGGDTCVGACAGSSNSADAGGSGGSGGHASGGGPSTDGNYTCPDPARDVLVDQTGLTLQAPTDAGMSVSFHGNHLGYARAGAKRLVIVASGTLTAFQLVRSTDQVPVLDLPLQTVSSFTAWGSTDQHFVADFSGYDGTGSFVVRANGQNSEPFQIADDLLFEQTIEDVLGYFKASRADDSDVWAADQSIAKYGSAETHDVRGGWYDASGDISKYLSHLSYANFLNPQQIPLVAWSLAEVHDRAGARLTTKGLLDDVAAEAVYGADYLVRILDDAGYFYATVFDNWTGDLSQRDICAFSGESGVKNANYQAAFREGGGMAIAALARVSQLGQDGAFSSSDYLEAAKKGFAHLLQNGASYADDGKENIIDDYAALLGASELYAATQDASYLDEARTRAKALTARMSDTGYFIADDGTRPFWHGSDAGLPVVALARYSEVETDQEERRAALDTIGQHLDYLVEVTNGVANPYDYARQHVSANGQASFFLPQDNESGYWWQGESARLGSLAAATRIGRRALAKEYGCERPLDAAAERYASAQLDWILGKNPLDISFLNGSGRNNPPAYCGDKAQSGTRAGGISNGITGQANDGSGFQWMPYANGDPENCWRNWRWVEQWLPHSTWYLMAISAELP